MTLAERLTALVQAIGADIKALKTANTGTNTGDQTSITGNAGSATLLALVDARATSPGPETFPMGITSQLKFNSSDGLDDGGSFHSVSTVRQWADFSGGLVHQLGYTDNQNIWYRVGTAIGTWGPWRQMLTATGTQTLTNKTLTGYTETVYALSGTSPALNPANGTVQTWTLTASSTPTSGLNAGQSLTLMVNDGTAYTVTWPGVVWVGGSAPTLAATGYTVVELWKVGATLYGALVGGVA